VICAAVIALACTFAGAPQPRVSTTRATPRLVWFDRGDEQQAPEVIAEVRVHGNHLTPDDEIVKLSGVAIGARFEATTIADITKRLRDTKKFDDVQVLKRYASIADPSQIVIVLMVNEGPVRIEVPDDPNQPVRVVKRGVVNNFMYMPIFDAEDGYGITFGVRVAYVGGQIGKRSRISFPFTWGGLKRAGAEYERTFQSGPLSRIEFGSVIQRQKNPAFEENDDRRRLWAKAERSVGPLRLGATGGWQHVTFIDGDDTFRTLGGEVTFDTRVDPVLPRNAVYATASRERVWFTTGESFDRIRMDARGYLGLIGQTILVVRALRQDATEPVPLYMKSLLGGWSSLRGFRAGSFIGDTMVTGSAEIRVPLNSPINVAKIGVSVFADFGKAYNKGEHFVDQPLERGVGAAVWMTLAAFRLSVGVAHGIGATTRVNFGGGLTF